MRSLHANAPLYIFRSVKEVQTFINDPVRDRIGQAVNENAGLVVARLRYKHEYRMPVTSRSAGM
jgi:hypothetical protein